MADIAINPVTRRVQFTGNTGTGPFAFTFNILQASDIVVYKNNVLQTLTTDYTVTINANGTGSITMVSALVATDVLIIVGGRELSRTTDFVTSGDLLAASLNEQLDSNVIMSQQLDERISRAVRSQPGDELMDLYLPLKADRADKVLSFDTEGNVQAQAASDLFSGSILGANYVNNTATGDGATVAFGVTVAPGSKNNIQIYIDGVYQNKATFSISGTTVTFSEAPPLNAAIEFIIGSAVTSISGDADSITYTQGATGSQQRTVENKLQEFVSVKDFGAVGDGVADDTAAIQAAIDYAETNNGKVIFPQANYKITSAITVTAPISIDGSMANIYQASANTNVFLFDEGTAGAGNYQNGFDVRNLLVRTAAGTGHAFVFRNINESTFENLLVAGCGDTAFYIQGCLLSKWTHCYVGDGLTASPGFFTSGASGNSYGFRVEGYNGLGANTNVFDRCSSTNSTTYAFYIAGTGNTLINCDAEGISSPAVAMYIDGLSTNIIGGNLEGTGGSISVQETNCTIKGANVLGGITVPSGVYGTNIIGGNVKQLILSAGSFNNTVIGTRISTGGFFNDLGTDNLSLNVYNFNTSTQGGMFLSGSFTPDLEFGGASGVSTYFQNQASWWRFGNIVHFTIWLQVNALTAATGTAKINMNDIPYTPAGSTDIPCSWSGNGVPIGAGYGNIIPIIDAGTKLISLNKVLDSTGIAANLDEGDFSSADQILVSGFFPLTLNT